MRTSLLLFIVRNAALTQMCLGVAAAPGQGCVRWSRVAGPRGVSWLGSACCQNGSGGCGTGCAVFGGTLCGLRCKQVFGKQNLLFFPVEIFTYKFRSCVFLLCLNAFQPEILGGLVQQ